MSKSSQYLDISFLVPHCYKFNDKILKNLRNSLVKATFKTRSNEEFGLACKIMNRKNQKHDEKFIEILKEISHPNIVHVHSIYQKNEILFLFMEWIDDGDLLKFIKQNGYLEENSAKSWFHQMILGLKYFHDKNIAHCNLSCANLMIRSNTIKISGLKYLRSTKNQELITMKSPLNMRFRAPEINLNLPFNPQIADIYSLGIILFVMLNAMFPFNSSDINELVEDQNNQRFSFRASNIHNLSIESQVTVHTLLDPVSKLRWNIDKILSLDWFKKLD
jgi:serine kinase